MLFEEVNSDFKNACRVSRHPPPPIFSPVIV